MALIKINAGGFDGETGIITFFPCSGGTINLGTHIMPYFYDTDYFIGVYSVYFPSLVKTCVVEIPCTYNNFALRINNQDFKQYECGELDNIDILNSQLLSVGVLEPGNERVLIPDSNIRLKNTSGILILNDTVEAAGNGIIVAPDGTYRNSDSTFTDSVNSGELNKLIPNIDLNVNSTLEGSIPSVKDIDIELEDGSSNTITPTNVTMVGDVLTIEIPIFGPDTVYTIEDTLGNILYSGITLSGLPFNQTIDNSIIENSDTSYSVSVLAEDSLTLPDQTIEVNSVNEGLISSVGTIDIDVNDGTNPVTPISVGVSGRTVTIEVPKSTHDLVLVDRFGNTLPTKQVSGDITWDLRTLTPYDWADLYLSRLTNPPTGAQETAVITFFDDMINAGLFQGSIKIELDIGGNAADHSWNARYPFDNNSSMRSEYIGSPTHNTNGVSLNGTSQLVRTNTYVRYLEDFNKEIAIYVRSCPYKDGQYIFNAGNGYTAQGFTFLQSAARNRWATEGLSIAPNTTAILGLNSIGRDSATTMYMKRNNVHTSFSPYTGTSIYNKVGDEITIGAFMSQSLVFSSFAELNYSYFRVGNALNDTQQTDHYNIVQALQTALGRQV